MASEKITKILDYTVSSCPKCGRKHDYKLKALVNAESAERVVLFGGAAGSEVFFTCSDTNQKFTQLVPNPSGGEITGLATEEDIAHATSVASAQPKPSPFEGDFAEWIKNSRNTAIDFCKTMLSSSTGAIPVYFVVLKYIGFDKITNTPFARAGILPPIMFLVAAVLFILALRPRFENIAQKDFATFRARRLTQINRFIIMGTLTFGGAIALAIVLFFSALWQ